MAKGKYRKWLEPDGLLLLRAWARDGLTDEQIAHNCGINTATLYDWKKKYSEISEALKKNKEISDIEVENALHKRAVGYEFTEEKVEMLIGGDGIPTGEKKVTQTIKGIPPDVGACALWLKNRNPDKWRDHPSTSSSDAGMLEQLLKGLKSDD